MPRRSLGPQLASGCQVCTGHYLGDPSGVYMCKSVVNDLRRGNYICKSEVIYLTYEHCIEIPVEFTYVNQ